MGDRLLNGAILGRILPQRQDSPLSSCSGGKCGLSPKMIASGVNNHTPHTITPPPEAAVQNIVSSVTQGAVPNSTTVTANLATTNKADTKGVVKLDNGVHARIVNGEIRVTIDLSKAEAKGTLESFRSGGGVLRTGTTDNLERLIDSNVSGFKLQKSMHGNNPDTPFLNVFAAKHLEKLELNFKASDGSTRKIEITRDAILAAEKKGIGNGAAAAATSSHGANKLSAEPSGAVGTSTAEPKVVPQVQGVISAPEIGPELKALKDALASDKKAQAGFFGGKTVTSVFKDIDVAGALLANKDPSAKVALLEQVGIEGISDTLGKMARYDRGPAVRKLIGDGLMKTLDKFNDNLSALVFSSGKEELKRIDALPEAEKKLLSLGWDAAYRANAMFGRKSLPFQQQLDWELGKSSSNTAAKASDPALSKPEVAPAPVNQPLVETKTSAASSHLDLKSELDKLKDLLSVDTKVHFKSLAGGTSSAIFKDLDTASSILAEKTSEQRLGLLKQVGIPQISETIGKMAYDDRPAAVKKLIGDDLMKKLDNFNSELSTFVFRSDKSELSKIDNLPPADKGLLSLGWDAIYRGKASFGRKSLPFQAQLDWELDKPTGSAVATSATPATSSTPARTEAATTPEPQYLSNFKAVWNKDLLYGMKSIADGIKDSDLNNKSKLEKLISNHSAMMKNGASSTNPDLEEILKVAADMRVKDSAWATRPWANNLIGLENTVNFLKNPEFWARPAETP